VKDELEIAKNIIEKRKKWMQFDGKLWQRNYWEHIIRKETEYNRIAQYIIDNPIKWENDKLNGGMEIFLGSQMPNII
jgi:putative transposase